MQFAVIVVRFAGFFNTKLQKRNIGLKHQQIPDFKSCIWIHCASLGEFEQGKVLIDALRRKYPNEKLVLTFFSSSGYEKTKNFDNVDSVLYLPFDIPKDMNAFINQLRPKLVVFVKYEFWFTLLDTLHKRRVPFVFVSSVFREDQYLFRAFYSSLLARIFYASHIFVQNTHSCKLLEEKGYSAVSQVGDTRIDRVVEIENQEFSWPSLNQWINDHICVIAGSTWPEGERIISQTIPSFPAMKWILAPHELGNDHLDSLRGLLGGEGMFLSELENMDAPIPEDKSVLVIDRIGLLSVLYRYGDIAYIGGGMGAGIHNTLEPAVYGLPLMFGPKYQKFQEAVDFLEQGVAHLVKSPEHMKRSLKYFCNNDHRKKISRTLKEYFKVHSGATTKIMKEIEKILPAE